MTDQSIELDYELIIQSLQFTRQKFEEYKDYPSYEFKQSQLQRVDRAIAQVRALRGGKNSAASKSTSEEL